MLQEVNLIINFRFYGIWKTVIFQKEFNVENISLEHIQKLVENARPEFKDEEKALIILQWSLRRDDRINALISRYASTQNDLTPFLDLIKSFPKEKPLYIPVPTVLYDNTQTSQEHIEEKIVKKRKISTSPSSNSDGRGRSRSVRDRSPMYSPSQSIERNDYRNGKSPRYFKNSDSDPSYYKPTSPSYSPMGPQ
jgi:hypothetical protein